MNSSKRYTEEFKIEAIKQVTERGYSIADVAKRLGTTIHTCYARLKRAASATSKECLIKILANKKNS